MASLRGLTLSGVSVATTAVGFIGQILLFRRFGAGSELDLYFYSLSIPSFLAGQIALVFGYYLVPYFSHEVEPGARVYFQRQLIKVLTLACVALSIPGIGVSLWMAPDAALAHIVGMPSLLPWLAVLSWTSVLIANLNAAQAAFLNVEMSFALPALFPLITQAFMMLALLLFADHGILVPLLGLNVGALLAWGLGAIALGRVDADMTRSGKTHPNSVGYENIWRFLRRASLLPLVLCIFSAHFFIDALVSAQLPPGDLSRLALAHRVNIGAVGVVVAAFAGPLTIDVSRLTNLLGQRQQVLGAYLRRLLVYGSATAAIVFFNADALATVLTGVQRGHAGASDLGSVGPLLRTLAIAGLPMLIGQFLLRAMLALHMHRASIVVAATWAGCYVVGAVLSVRVAGALGLATTYLVAWAALTVGAALALGLRPHVVSVIARGLLCAMIAVCAWIGREMCSLTTLPWPEATSLAGSIIATAAAAYGADRWASTRLLNT